MLNKMAHGPQATLQQVLSNRESQALVRMSMKNPEAIDPKALLQSGRDREPLATGPICRGFFELLTRGPCSRLCATCAKRVFPEVILCFCARRRGRAAEGTRLLNEHTPKRVSRVRIPPSPPLLVFNRLKNYIFYVNCKLGPNLGPNSTARVFQAFVPMIPSTPRSMQ